MALFEEMLEDCTLLRAVRVPDREGGQKTQWEEGEDFRAAVLADRLGQARRAEKETPDSGYTVTADRPLGFGDVFRRQRDGRTFRIRTEDRRPPDRASFRFFQGEAELWEMK